jgi:hypothetical protein
VRILKTKWFTRFAQRERISDDSLYEAALRAERGLIDADLGGGVIKQRVARPGQGRSGGYRVLLAYRRGMVTVFLYGFAKNERDNINKDQLETLRDIARAWLEAETGMIDRAIQEGTLNEVRYDRGE